MDLSTASTLNALQVSERVILGIEILKKSAEAERTVAGAVGTGVDPNVFNESGSVSSVRPVGQILSESA